MGHIFSFCQNIFFGRAGPFKFYLSFQIYIHLVESNMINKNVADYTNFDGKTNKKIVQAPGGQSNFSIGWSNEKTDYGPDRVMKKKSNYNEEPPMNAGNNYQKQGNFNYNEPIRVMEPQYEQPQYPPKYNNYPSSSSQQINKYGGQQGYNNYGHQQPPRNKGYNQHDSLDLTVQEHIKIKAAQSKPPINNNNGQKASIKIIEQRSNNIFGENSYNYWNEERKGTNQSSKRPQSYEQQPQYPQKTSIKVHNPPGGKTSFTLG